MTTSATGRMSRARARARDWLERRLHLHFRRSVYGVHLQSAKRHPLMRACAIDLVLDVGANAGQYAQALRRSGYRGSIISFEPQARPFEGLAEQAAQDPRWECRHTALGEHTGTVEMHVASNAGLCSSLLAPTEHLLDNVPESRFDTIERVAIELLDGAVGQALRDRSGIMLKVDAQGYELSVLRGGESVVSQASLIELELSLLPLYGDAPTLSQVTEYLHAHDFATVSLEPAYANPSTGELLQLNGLFVRRRRAW
jgi:FkbM family methyltransferase